MNKRDEHKFKIGCLVIIGIIVAAIAQYYIRQVTINNEINHFGKYTIGTTYDRIIASKGNDYIRYFFFYKGNKYIGDANLQLNIKVPGGRFYVLFSTKNPNNSYVYFEKPVPDSIKEAPVEGWVKLPPVERRLQP